MGLFMKRMLTIIGICYSVYAAAIIVFVFSRINAVLKLIMLDSGKGNLAFSQYMPVITVGAIGVFLAFLTFFLSVLLIRRKKRRLCMILACIFLIEIPVGTVLGIFTVILLTSPLIKQEFRN